MSCKTTPVRMCVSERFYPFVHDVLDLLNAGRLEDI